MVNLLFLGYLLVFLAGAGACFAGAHRVRKIKDPDTRRGLLWLLAGSGGWATAHVIFLLVPTADLKNLMYMVGLEIGFATVGPWLYFCSAYTGRSLHRNPNLRRVGIALFLAIATVKLTNSLHHLYFRGALRTTPFPHLAVETGIFHWIVMGLSYALAAVGYFMLLELFLRVSYDTKPISGLIAITALPIALDVIGYASPLLINITYEPIGVAVFATGICYLYLDRFQAIQLTGDTEDPVIVLSAAGKIRDYNEAAGERFRDLQKKTVVGRSFDEVLPEIADALDEGTNIIEIEDDDISRYYRVSTTSFGGTHSNSGGWVLLSDISEREQYRRELERQNERLEEFANIVSHDLRNPLEVAMGWLDMAREEGTNEYLDTVANAHSRMEELIDDLLTPAREGQPIDAVETVDLGSLARNCWHVIEKENAELEVGGELMLEADSGRLQQLLENLFRNAIEHGGSGVTVRIGPLPEGSGFYIADDGEGIPETDRDQVFESGYSTEETGTGFGLAIVAEIVDAHGWEIRVTNSREGGARFEIRDVEFV